MRSYSNSGLSLQTFLFMFVVIIVAMVVVNASMSSLRENREREEARPFDFRTFDRPILTDAPGCEIRSPTGELLNHIFKDAPSDKVRVQKGTTFTIDCFPILATEEAVLQGGK